MKERKIGIMGGTFNPIHYGHLLLAENAREQFGLDRVIFIPSGTPYLKDTSKLPSGDLRYQLVKIAIQNNPYFTFSRLEIDRTGDTYTVDTLLQLEKMYPGDQLYFIVGADSLMDMERWKRTRDIFSHCIILASIRGEISLTDLEKKQLELASKYQANIHLLKGDRVDISSTDIRSRIASGKSVRYLMSQECIEFVYLKNFYIGDTIGAGDIEAPDQIALPIRHQRH